MGRLSVQPRDALSEGCQAVPPGCTSRPPDDGGPTRPVSGSRVQPVTVRRGDRASRRRDRSPPARARRPGDRRSERRQPDDREDVLDGQVRARVPANAVHRLQRPAVHGERRRREQEGVWHRPRHQSLGRHDRHRSDLGCRLQRRGVCTDHDELPLAGARTRRQDHRSRSAHHACRPHVRSLPAGPARARCGALCRRAAPHDRARLARSSVHRHFHGRLRSSR